MPRLLFPHEDHGGPDGARLLGPRPVGRGELKPRSMPTSHLRTTRPSPGTGSVRCSPTGPSPSTNSSTPDDLTLRIAASRTNCGKQFSPIGSRAVHGCRPRPAAGRRLGVEPDQVMTATFRRVHDGVAFCSTRVFLPDEIGALLLDAPELTQAGLRSKATVIGLITPPRTSPSPRPSRTSRWRRCPARSRATSECRRT
jgi:hypothetical protein